MKALGSLRLAVYVGPYLTKGPKTESVGARICPVVRPVINLGTVERGVRASGISSNAEGVLGGESQDSTTRIVEGSWDLVTSVENGRGDPDTSTWVSGTDVLAARPRGA